MTLAPKWLTPKGSIGTFPQGKNASFTVDTIGARDFDLVAGNVNSIGYFSFQITTGTSYTDVTSLTITGTPFTVNQDVSTEFVLRASNEYGVIDRTFSINVTGPTDPEWITPSGYLQLGPNLEPYCINKNRVDFTLQATTLVVPKNQKITYYIADNDGQLPPGLRLNPNTGIISGYVNDQLSIDFLASKTGGYDAEFYDGYPYDHALLFGNTVEGRLVSITKIYQFYVTVTDGISSARRKFQIRVEDPNTFRTDTTQITDDTTNYLSNIGYLIPPIWLDTDSSLLPNPSNLGTLRANNNQVIDLNAYDPYPFVGPVTFDWELIKVNPEIRFLSNSETNAVGTPISNTIGSGYLITQKTVGVPAVGMSLQLNPYVKNAGSTVYRINTVEKYGDDGYKLGLGVLTKYKSDVNTLNDLPLSNSPGDMYKVLSSNRYFVCNGLPNSFIDIGINALGFINYQLELNVPDITTLFVGSLSSQPPGIELDTEQGILYGRIPYQPAYSRNYRFTVRITKTDQETGETVSNNHIFNLTLKGDIETTIQFLSDEVLGDLKPGHISDISVVAKHTSADLDVTYSLTGGKLPPGLLLTPTGNITGVIPTNIQTNFDIAATGFNTTTFDVGATTFDKSYTFNVTARDSYLFSAISKDFTINILENTIIPYTNIFVRPLLKRDQRAYLRNLVENYSIFDSSLIYRRDDPNFGVQSSVKMTIQYGAQKIDLDKYVPALTYYFKRRRYFFGELKSAVAVDSAGNHVYDVVYLDIVDDQMIGNQISVAPSFTQEVNGQVVTYYPDSVINEQFAIKEIEVDVGHPLSIDDDYRPKFMQTLQNDTGIPLGFVKAFILCYSLPNQSGKIISNIKRSGFDFKLIDFDVDRIAIENPLDYNGTRYLLFGSGTADTGFYITSEDDQDLLTEDSVELSL
jgi:hypothetical protein